MNQRSNTIPITSNANGACISMAEAANSEDDLNPTPHRVRPMCPRSAAQQSQLNAEADERRQRDAYYAKFVPETVQRLVAANPEAPDLSMRECDVSVLFIDICGYSRLSEKMSPAALNTLVEQYFSAFLDCHLLGYNGSCGSCSTPFMEPETSKFSSQLSAYHLPLSRSAGHDCPPCFFTLCGDEGQKFQSKAKARTRFSADSGRPWKYCALKKARSRNRIKRSTILRVRGAKGCSSLGLKAARWSHKSRVSCFLSDSGKTSEAHSVRRLRR